MAVQFAEVWKSSGLDVDATPFPAMILPLRGSNVIRVLHAQGSSLYDDKGILEIEEIDGGDIVLSKFFAFTVPIFKLMAGHPGEMVALQLKLATDVAQKLAHNGRYIRITGRALGGGDGTMLRVGTEPNLPLRVVVLRPRPLKLSIRPVQIRNNKGSLVPHCERDTDAKALCSEVNAIWTPQANIVFELASSNPALMDDEVRIAKALGGFSQKATLPKIVEFNDFEDMFKELKEKENPKADFTIFLVDSLTHNGYRTGGTTSIQNGFALVSDDGRTMAHEIGHYFGTLGKGSLYDEVYGNTKEDLLMGAGGDGTKVPFKDVIKYFNTNYK